LREQNYQCLSSRVVSNHFEIFTCRRWTFRGYSLQIEIGKYIFPRTHK
jgi:hypothetical protein